MILKTKFLKKIFSLKFKPKYIFSNKESPTDRYSKLIDSYISEFQNPKKSFPNFKDDIIKMTMIQFDVAEESIKHSKESEDPIAKLKAFTDKMNANLDEDENIPFPGKKKDRKMDEQEENEKDEEDEDEDESDSFDESESNSLFGEEKKEKSLKNENYDNLKQFQKKGEKPKKSDEESSSSEDSNEKSEKTDERKVEPEKKFESEKKDENLFEKDGKYFESTSQGLDFIPQNLIIKTLIFPKNHSEVLLLGVEKRNETHASFMLDLVNKLKFDNIVTQIAPDQPFFIKTEDKYLNAWERFLKGKFDYKFVINPNPTNLSDLILDANRLKFLMDGSFLKTTEEFELGSTFFYSKRAKTQKKEVDCFLTPFLYSYNNSEKMIPIIVNDFPIIPYREYVNRNMNLPDLQQLYDSFVEAEQKGKKHFDPALMKPEIFIQPKINYITEVIKQSCFLGKKILAVVDMNCAEMIAETWKNSKHLAKIKNLQGLLKNVKMEEGDDQVTFSDYIEKHVILDLMLDNFIQENFVDYKSFPFTGENTVGKTMNFGNVFMIWNHFQRKYKKSIKKGKSLEDMKEKVQENMADFEDTDVVLRNMKKIENKKKRKN